MKIDICPVCGCDSIPHNKSIVKIGDKIRFSTELLKQIHENPYHHSEIVVVEKIETKNDGCKTILLRKVE